MCIDLFKLVRVKRALGKAGLERLDALDSALKRYMKMFLLFLSFVFRIEETLYAPNLS